MNRAHDARCRTDTGRGRATVVVGLPFAGMKVEIDALAATLFTDGEGNAHSPLRG